MSSKADNGGFLHNRRKRLQNAVFCSAAFLLSVGVRGGTHSLQGQILAGCSWPAPDRRKQCQPSLGCLGSFSRKSWESPNRGSPLLLLEDLLS